MWKSSDSKDVTFNIRCQATVEGSMKRRLGVMIAIGMSVSCSALHAQTTAIDMRRPRAPADSVNRVKLSGASGQGG
jgi:hypothetical protein